VPHFEMTAEPFADGVRVEIAGELDLVCAYTFDARLREIEAEGPGLVVLDLRRLTFVDSAGIGRIVAAHLRARRARRRLVMVRVSRTVQRVLTLTALDTVFEMVSEPEAVLA
jgi:anti-sigma B factor antagonist